MNKYYKFKVALFFILFFIKSFFCSSQAFTASWPLTTDLSATITGPITANSATLNNIFFNSTSFSGSGLTGSGIVSRATSTCSNTYDFISTTTLPTPLYSYLEYKVYPNSITDNLVISPISFTVSEPLSLYPNISRLCVGYSLDGGLTFNPFNITTSSLNASAQNGPLGSLFSINQSTIFNVKTFTNLVVNTGKPFIVRIIIWRSNFVTGNETSFLYTISGLNLTGSCSKAIIYSSPISLTNFVSYPATNPSNSQAFNVSGVNLFGDITVTAPTNYEINNPSINSTYSSSLLLSQVSGNVANTTLNVRLKSGLSTGQYNGNISITSLNTNPNYISLTGKTCDIGTLTSLSSAVCPNKTAFFNLSNYTGNIQWQSSSDNSTFVNIPFITNTTSYTTPSLTSSKYYKVTLSDSYCNTYTSNSVSVLVKNTKTWNGTSWDGDGNTPTIVEPVVFNGNFSSSSDVGGCNCTINSGNVVFNTGHTLNIVDALTINSGTITFQNGASLLQTNTTANTAAISYNRTTSPVRQLDYTYWSSPITSQTLIGLSPTTPISKFYSYNGTTSSWFQETSNNNMTLGKGYIIRAPIGNDPVTPTPYNATFNGIPNNGNISSPSVAGLNKFNLIGNPYPSALDIEAFYEDNNAKIKPNFFFWTHNTAITNNVYSNNDYAVYNAVLGAGVGTGSAASTGGNAPDQYVDACQGFFVTSLTTGALSFKNTQRVSGNNNAFYRHSNQNYSSSNSYKFWLNLSNNDGFFKQQLITYTDGATNDLDDLYDLVSIDSYNFGDFYSLTNNDTKYTIQSRTFPFDNQDIVNLGLKVTNTSDYKISIDHFDDFFTNQDIFLVDNQLGVYQNLKNGDYSFTSDSGTFDNRFTIQYYAPTLGIVENNLENNQVKVYSNNGILNINSTNLNIKNTKITDVLGRTIISKKDINQVQDTYTYLSKNQIILVTIELESGYKITRKVIIQ